MYPHTRHGLCSDFSGSTHMVVTHWAMLSFHTHARTPIKILFWSLGLRPNETFSWYTRIKDMHTCVFSLKSRVLRINSSLQRTKRGVGVTRWVNIRERCGKTMRENKSVFFLRHKHAVSARMSETCKHNKMQKPDIKPYLPQRRRGSKPGAMCVFVYSMCCVSGWEIHFL